MRIVPCSLRQANAFVTEHHRHHGPTRGHKFSVAIEKAGQIIGVAIAGRPVARALDDGLTLEVNRTCTVGAPNANSMLYGAVRRAAWAMGYERLYTYTQEGESGASLHAAGFRIDAELDARGSWAESSVRLRDIRDPIGVGGVGRLRWVADRDGGRCAVATS